MGLEHIRSCRVLFIGDEVLVLGIDKITNKEHQVRVNREEYDKWQDGMPIQIAIPSLTKEDARFLRRGTTQLLIIKGD